MSTPALSWRQAPRARLLHALRYRRTRLKRFWKQYFVKTRFGARSLRNVMTDLRWGGYCGGARATSHGEFGAYGTSSTDYAELPRIFCEQNGTAIGPDDVLVDVGCGKGRAINWWLSLGLGNKIFGLELEEKIAAKARRRLRKHDNVAIISGNALEHLPPDATMIFLFHPFNRQVFEAFKERIVEVYGEDSNLRIVYLLALFDAVFIEDPRFSVVPFQRKTFYRGAVIRLRGAQPRQERDEDVGHRTQF